MNNYLFCTLFIFDLNNKT